MVKCAKSDIRSRLFGMCVAAFAVLGVILRLRQYSFNRALWIDEACLVLNILEKTPRQLLGPLDYAQNSPLAFLVSTKYVTMFFGDSEYALRLIPLLAGLATLPLAVWLATKIARANPEARQWSILTGIAMFATAKHLIYYSSEVRHYSLDILFVCIFYLLIFGENGGLNHSPCRIFTLALVGLIGIWFSLASIFILAGISLVFLGDRLIAKDRQGVIGWILCGGAWGIAFLSHTTIHNWNIAARDLGDEINVYNAMSFMPLPPQSFADLKWFREAFERLFYFPGGFTYSGLAGFAFLAGLISWWKRDKRLCMVMTLPVLLALVASGMHRYPFRDRYNLFLIPLIFLAIAEGIGFLAEAFQNRTRWIPAILTLLLIIQPFAHGSMYLAKPRGGYQIKPLMERLRADMQPGDILYVPLIEVHPVMYYAKKYGIGDKDIEYEPRQPSLMGTDSEYRKARWSTLLQTYGRLWILFGHDTPPPIPCAANGVDSVGKQIEMTQSDGATLYLYEKTP